MRRRAVAAGLLALTCLAANCDYRPDQPLLINESGEPLEAHLFHELDGTLGPSIISPQEFTDSLQLASREGCANFHVLELRRPDSQEVLVRHDFREQPLCENEAWVYRGGDELIADP